MEKFLPKNSRIFPGKAKICPYCGQKPCKKKCKNEQKKQVGVRRGKDRLYSSKWTGYVRPKVKKSTDE